MITRVRYAANIPVYPSINEALCSFGIQQQMIEPKPGISLPTISRVIPERVHRRIGMQRSNRVNPAVFQKAAEQGARLRLHERIVLVGFRRVYVAIGRYDVVVACQHDGRIEHIKLRCMRDETLHPSELVSEFWSWLRVAVWRVERPNKHAIDGCLDVAALRVRRIAGQCGVRGDGIAATCEDCDPIP